MPQFDGRYDIERQLIEALSRESAQIRRDLLRLLGDPPRLDNLTDANWRDIESRFSGVIRPELEEAFIQAAVNYSDSIGFAVATDIVNDAARQWSQQYTFELVQGMTDRRRRALQNTFSQFFDAPMNNRELRRILAREFGPVRAEMISITEVTRAVAEGERVVTDDLARQGVQTVAVWQTMADERVCPVCGPRHGKRQGDGWQMLPPAHPRCRCFVNYEVVVDENSG